MRSILSGKRGEEESSPMGKVITMIIIIAVVAVVYLFIFGPGKSILQKFNLLPSFNDSSQEISSQTKYVRFDAVDFKLKYYDETEWTDITDKIKLKGVDYEYDNFKDLLDIQTELKNGKDYLFENKLRVPPRTDSWNKLKAIADDELDTSKSSSSTSMYLNLIGVMDRRIYITDFETGRNPIGPGINGDYLFYVIDASAGIPSSMQDAETYGVLVYKIKDTENKIDFLPQRGGVHESLPRSGEVAVESPELVNLVKNYIDDTIGKIWTEKPIKVKDNYYCVDFRSQRYFIVDLTNPVGEGANCLA